MQEFINECKDMETIQPQLDKIREEAEKQKTETGDIDVPQSFGKAPENASEFKPVMIKSKKRDLQTMQNGVTPDENKENKIRKLNE